MPLPARNTLAVIGAGPAGLEVALAALDQGFDVHLFEQGEVGSHPLGWGHVTMFTPWRMNVGPATRAHLERGGWTAPDPESRPTGREYAERCLEPAAAVPALAQRLHRFAQVVHVSRRGALKGDGPAAMRAEHPFRLLVRDPGGRESFLHAFAVVDASGVYHKPNWAGDGGIPARSEIALAPQMTYHLPDVLGAARARFAGRRTIVIGGGPGAATTVVALAALAREAPGTRVVWATRAAQPVADGGAALPARAALAAEARALAAAGDDAFTHAGGAVVEGFEFNSATHRYRVALRVGEAARVEEVDEVVVHAGYGPDRSLHRELQVAETPSSLAAVRSPDAPETAEPGFFVIGHKSAGRSGEFLLETAFRQAAAVVAALQPRAFSGARG